ncbi:hypothetical protein [Aquisphaera insulae]|uniref:hypothetical protein n=1 Tax=Aquisphaera insulae TaxID=2712864 RepID=UPI0013EDEB48|nr:hypothetical protein [Aquisphaera insulae]
MTARPYDRPGRPRMWSNERVLVQVPFSAADRDRLDALATARDLSRARLAHRLLMDAVARLEESPLSQEAIR